MKLKFWKREPKNENTFEFVTKDDQFGIKCLDCGMTSWNENDVENKYCGNCHEFHEFKRLNRWMDREDRKFVALIWAINIPIGLIVWGAFIVNICAFWFGYQIYNPNSNGTELFFRMLVSGGVGAAWGMHITHGILEPVRRMKKQKAERVALQKRREEIIYGRTR